MSRFKLINPSTLPPPKGFNHAVVTPPGPLVFVAGQIGCDVNGAMVSSDLVGQFELALRHVVEAVTEAGGTPESIARITIYVTDMVEYRARLKGLGQAWQRVMGKHFPAMALVEVQSLFVPNCKVEMEATAVL
ncbi:MAG: RidA family protein [Candidatus Polarisedimenticolia bacterium]